MAKAPPKSTASSGWQLLFEPGTGAFSKETCNVGDDEELEAPPEGFSRKNFSYTESVIDTLLERRQAK